MSEAAHSSPPTLHRLFYNASEPRAGWRLLIFLAVVITLISGGDWMIRQVLNGAGDTTVFLVREAMDFLVFLLASWIMGHIEGRTIADYGLPWRAMLRGRFWQGAAAGFAAITVTLLAMWALGVVRFEGIALHGADVWKWALVYALVFLLIALREEFRARGYALYTLASGIGFWPAALCSAGFFAYSHHGNSGEDWIGLLNAALAGLLFCLLLRRSGNLWMPIGFHLAFDWGETYFYGVADSGQVLPGHLLNSSASGPGWLSGGTVGPEGSVVCTVALLAAALICSAWMRQVKYPGPGRKRAGQPALSFRLTSGE